MLWAATCDRRSTLSGGWPVAEFLDQWSRTLRWRDRYAEALDNGPPELMSMRTITPERLIQIHDWFGEQHDFALVVCMNIHHLKDWAQNDDAVPIDRSAAEAFIDTDRSLGMMSDIANGLKHLRYGRGYRPRGGVVDPAQIAQSVRMAWRERDGARVLHVEHEVELGNGSHVELIEIVDRAISMWRRLLRANGVLGSA
jgi:hypothetical protein